jgi:hypothetical protein
MASRARHVIFSLVYLMAATVAVAADPTGTPHPIPGIDFSKPGPVPSAAPSFAPERPPRGRGRSRVPRPAQPGDPTAGVGVNGGNYSGGGVNGLGKVKIGF